MKIVTKVVYTTTINDDGGYTETVKKTVTVVDESFDSLDAEQLHNAVFKTLCNKDPVQ